MAHLLCAISAVFLFIGLHAASVQAICASSWCLNGATCDDDPMGCVCLEGFAGFYCEIELTGDESCVESLCLNGGICMEEAVVCSCQDGFTGYFCETEVCQYDTDCNGGECVNDSSASSVVEPQCVACPMMFAGPRCETPFGPLCGMMVNGICLNGGTCIPRPDSTQEFTCMCPENYAGPNCQVYKICSDINPCRNDGDCVGGSCICVDTFVGVLCERSCMDNAQCLNGGSCLSTGVCLCIGGYEGVRCGLVPCTPENMDCLNDGTCNADGACECINNFQGRKCEIACKGNPRCMNGATCSDMGTCLCPNGYEGARCEMQTELCVENRDCLNGGSCIIADGICECASDFQGTFCEIACMTDVQCMNGGHCEVSGMCECVNGFQGARCQNSASIDVTLIVAVVAGVVVLLLVIVLLLLLVRKRLAKRRLPKGQNGQLELGVRNTSRGNSYIGVNDGGKPPVANRPGELKYQTGGKPKEFPRDWLHVMEQLGAGSFATVHRAEADGIIKKGAMTTVAVKMLKTTATEGDKSDFEKERSMYLTLGSHPNVVTMMGFCTEKEPFYLIMEYLPNGNLQTYLRHVRTGSQEQYFDLKEAKEERRNFLVPAEILSFANQIANGMEFLASKSCIHRDLATRNILLGDDLVAKVSDFGLARDVQDSSQYEMKSKGRVPVRWMAPESLLDNIYTSKSDVWGFAVLLWELVTLGSHPYPGMSSKQVMDRVGVGYRLPKPESCSDEIYNMMKQCWNKNPQDRPTFTEICKLLDEMMADASGYLIMSDLKREDYLYLEPNQTKSVNTADDY